MNDPQATPDPSPAPVAGTLDRALALVEFLRAHCPWDARQTHDSLRRYLLEESHEVVDAIAARDDGALRDELGDLLLNLAFQVVLAEERDAFDRDAVVRALEDKMRRRHPHLYGLGEPQSWEALKARERADADRPASALDEVPRGADPLQRADRLQAAVARVGFDWAEPRGAWNKLREEIEEFGAELEAGDAVRMEDELGDVLFSVVNLARLAGVHAPSALSRANAKFERRFAALERLAAERGLRWEHATLEQLDALWDEVKRGER